MNNDLRNRLRKAKTPDQSVDSKLAEFFSSDEKLKKYGKKSTDSDQEENDFVVELKKLYRKVVGQTKKTVDSLRSKNTSILRLRRKTVLSVGSIAAILLFLLLIGGMFARDKQDGTPSVQGTATEIEAVEPEFATATIGGEYESTKVAYDAERKVASFGVTLDSGTDVIISQQEISAADASRENFLLSVAQSFDINREVQTEKGPLFIGSNQKQRVVTAVYQEGVFLFFIRSNNLVDDDQIITLVEELQI